MKKEIIIQTAGLVFTACLYFPTYSTPALTYQTPIHALQGRVEVKVEELPEKVRNTLNDKSYAGWTIIEAFLVTNEDNSQYYELVVRRADERTRMKVDADGNVLN